MLLGVETHAFAPGTERSFLPQLISAPADERKLRVRRRRHAAPMPVYNHQLQLEFSARRQSHLTDPVKPLLGIHATVGLGVPVLAELDRNPRRFAVPIAQNRRNAGDGHTDVMANAAPRFLEHQARDLLTIRRIRQSECYTLHRIVGSGTIRNDSIKVDAMPTQRGIELHRTIARVHHHWAL